MGKSKKNKYMPRRRKRRISGIGGNLNGIIMNVAGVTAGVFIGNAISKMAAGKVDPKILAAGKIASVLIIPKFIPGAMGQALGNGLLAVGSIELLQGFKVIQGVGDEVDFAISGTDNMHLISGDERQLISGTGDENEDAISPMSQLAIAGTM